jgi:hypothetical protein
VSYNNQSFRRTLVTVAALTCCWTMSEARAQYPAIDVPFDGLIIDAGTYSGTSGTGLLAYAKDLLVPLLNAGRNGGTWDGHGLYSSYVAGIDASVDGEYLALGMIINSEMASRYGYYYKTFGGVDLTTLSDPNPMNYVFLKPTFVGDTNLDGVVDGFDQANFDANYGQAVDDVNMPRAVAWMVGDFFHDDLVGADDAQALSQNMGSTPENTGLEIHHDYWVAVPEPSTWALLVAAALGLARFGFHRKSRTPSRLA